MMEAKGKESIAAWDMVRSPGLSAHSLTLTQVLKFAFVPGYIRRSQCRVFLHVTCTA